jgi:GMP synthase-like glutamine amidotransferase
MKPILIIKNNVHEGPGIIEEILLERKIAYEIKDLDRGDEFPESENYSALIILGGPDSSNDDTPKMKQELERVKEALELELPILGICLGMQVLCKAAGGNVKKSPYMEIGFFHENHEAYTIEHLTNDPILTGLPKPFRVFQLHNETIELPSPVKLIGKGNFIEPQVIKVGTNAYGFQCHFELTKAIIEECLENDEYLKQRDDVKLREQWDAFQNDYFRKGKIITENFLKISGHILTHSFHKASTLHHP